MGQGTVLQKGAEPPQLCLGAVMESYPPQCSGPFIRNWDWSEADGEATASGVTWGAYAVAGTWDGTEFTQTRDPIPLSLYDPPRPTAPGLGEGPAGAGTEAQLELIRDEVHSSYGGTILISEIRNGYLILDVFYDDGALQKEMDPRYGSNLILVRSALKPASG